MKIGLLTNEIPPIVYGGVATWILNFLDMFRDDDDIEIIPVFLAQLDEPPADFSERYPGIRIIHGPDDVKNAFADLDACINNLWVAFDTTRTIKETFQDKLMISVCHSLIKMEHITNMGGPITSNYFEQEITFQYSDIVVLISKAEKKHYISFGYDKYGSVPHVIYNSYKPKLDDEPWRPDYDLNDVGYIGRHVPRKRPDLPIFAVERSQRKDIRVFNMGVDYRGVQGNPFWEELGRKHPKQLIIIPFSSNKETAHFYWNSIGANSITGIYEPFGYTMCETLDRRVPAIVQNIDGPSEITANVQDSVFIYNVDQDFSKDVDNFLLALQKFWDTHPDDRRAMAEHARTALDDFRPEVIKLKWKDILLHTEPKEIKGLQGRHSKQGIPQKTDKGYGGGGYNY
ncbi:MAG TPA: glycosyltransferase family 1 protein [Candidatus Marinimicrobia bacterium]|nr:glycosyltransferase family 1 protein [Candidatus Neomarinimicrobiota bacterium]